MPTDPAPDALPESLGPVAAALTANQPRQAVQLFRGLCEQGRIPCRAGEVTWLIRNLGREPTVRLIDAFARTPCFYCRGGLERCPDCDGRGYLDDDTACETCIGLGLARCDCCEGSGWVGIDFVPECLQPGVILDRARHALRDIDRLTHQLAEASRDPFRPHALKDDAAILLRFNGLLGVLETDILDAQHLHLNSHYTATHIVELTHRWIGTALRTQKRIAEVLRRMEIDARAEAERSTDRPHARTVAQRRAALFRRLRHGRGIERTGLDHPFLEAAVRRMRAAGETFDSLDLPEPPGPEGASE